ncbi:MAG: hypothetical protein LBV08_07055 [Clostridiales bacterium]|nr:hypothetical protein [Clostridiales bacterium]
MQILDDLYLETKRLFIAGGKFAKGDPRISKHIPILKKMGEKAQALKKLAELYETLVKEGRPEDLESCGVFLHAIMSTQAATEIKGDEVEGHAEIFELPGTVIPYSRLNPILEALTLSQPGRLEVIKNAFADGLLNDYRAFAPIISALDDKFHELVDYLHNEAIPSLGGAVVPYILESYNPGGKRGDAIRLSLLGKLGYGQAEKLAFDAINNGTQVVAVEGIKILGGNPKNEEFLLKLVKDKKSAIAESALVSLINMGSVEGGGLMLEVLQSKKYKTAIEAAKLCSGLELTNGILAIAKKEFQNLMEDDLGSFKDGNIKFLELAPVLENKNYQAVYDFYGQVLSDRKYPALLKENSLLSWYNDARALISHQLEKCPCSESIKVFEDNCTPGAAMDAEYIAKVYCNMARRVYSKDKMFSVFSEYYATGSLNFVDIFGNVDLSSAGGYEEIRGAVSEEWEKLFLNKKDLLAIGVFIHKGCGFFDAYKDIILSLLNEGKPGKKGPSMLNLGFAAKRLLITFTSQKEIEAFADICYKVFERAGEQIARSFYEGLSEECFLRLFYPKYSQQFAELAKKKGSYHFKIIEGLLQKPDK